MQKCLSYLALLITTLVVSACSGGSCATAPNDGQLPLAYTFPDGTKLYGNTAVNVNSGSSTTGTFVLQGAGSESTEVTLIATQKLAKQATNSLQRAAEISGKFNPRTLFVTGQGSESVSTLTVTVEDNLPAGTYTLGLYAVNLTVNGVIVSPESQIGELTVEVKGGVSPTPSPSPTVTPTPIPTITPTPNPSPTVTPTPTPSPSPTPVAGTLQIAPPAESIINSGDTTTAVVSLEGSQNITTPVVVTITSNNPAVMTVESDSCNLTTESNNCTITLIGKSAGSTTFSAAASGYTTATSESVVVVAAWTWIGGGNTINNTGIYGTKGIESAGNIPGARQGSISWRDESGNMWLFGGRGYAASGSGNLNDLWKYNPTTNAWTWISGGNTINNTGIYGTKGIESAGNIPGTRQGSISWRDESGNLWLFGGNGYPNVGGSGNLNDLWKYSPINNAWTWVSGSNTTYSFGVYGTKGIESAGNIPGARQGSISWRDESGNLWLFGGDGFAASGSGNLNDLWKYNPITNAWTWVSGDNDTNSLGVYGNNGVESITNIPGARQASISWRDESSNLWLFGGRGYAESGSPNSLNDLWKYNPHTNAWTWISGDNDTNSRGIYGTKSVGNTTNIAGARQFSISWYNSGQLWLFGGFGYAESGAAASLNDLWVYKY